MLGIKFAIALFKGVIGFWLDTILPEPGVWGTKNDDAEGLFWAIYTLTSGISILNSEMVSIKDFLNDGSSS